MCWIGVPGPRILRRYLPFTSEEVPMRTPRRLYPFRLALPLGGLAVLAALGALLAAPPQGRRFAVFVGVKEYDHAKLKALDYPENDAADLARLLGQAGYEVVLLTGAEGKREEGRRPTLANIRSQLEAVLRQCKRHDTVLVGLAGHGLQFDGKKDSYFCP